MYSKYRRLASARLIELWVRGSRETVEVVVS
jgi:hypothetical protein